MDDLTQRQQRLLDQMLRYIASYNEGALSFQDLVSSLEGALDAADLGDQNFIRKWYDLWTPLEVLRAVRAGSVSPDEVANELGALAEHIQQRLATAAPGERDDLDSMSGC